MYVMIPYYLIFTVIPKFMLFISEQIIPEFGIIIMGKLLLIIPVFVVYKKVISTISGKLQFNLKNEWIEYLTLKGRKIKYYKFLTITGTAVQDIHTLFLKLSEYMEEVYGILFKFFVVTSTLLSYFLFSSIISTRLGYDLWSNKIFINYVNNVSADYVDLIVAFSLSVAITFIALLMIVIIILYILESLIKCMFPVMKVNGKITIDTSDVLISFIESAIVELELFNFLDTFIQKQTKKYEITQLISYALNFFVKVDNGKERPDIMNFWRVLWAGHLSPAARNDVLFRANGLYKKMDELCAKINNMNSHDDKDAIVQELKMYLQMIKDRDLSKIEEVPYEIKKSNLTTFLIRAVMVLQKII